MEATIAQLNEYRKQFNVTEVSPLRGYSGRVVYSALHFQPSLLNFCVTDGESVVVSRYISSRTDEAASLVRHSTANSSLPSSSIYG